MKKLTAIAKEYKLLMTGFAEGLPRFLKYQIITKFLLSAIIFPGFSLIVQTLINMRGLRAVSNNEIFKFILSPYGIIFLVIGTGVLLCGVLVEIGGLIMLSAQIFFKKPESSYKELLKANLKQLPKMREFGTLFLILYIIIIVPLSGFGATLSFISDLRIPNFIASVIETDSLYSILYFAIIAVIIFFSLRWIFCFHFLIIGGNKPSQALKNSAKLLKGNRKKFFAVFICISFINIFILSGLTVLWMSAFSYLANFLNLSLTFGRVFMVLLIIMQNIILSLITLLVIPFELYMLTVLFYDFIKKNKDFGAYISAYPILPEKTKLSLIDRILKRKKTCFVLVSFLVIIISIPLGLFFDDIFKSKREIIIIGHRGGGGFEIPENSLSSIKESIKHAAHFVEIDVQRTKDGFYIINHDKTFARMAGENRSAQDMTLEEIKNLDIGKNYPGYKGEQVCTLEEVLDLCKNKIGIFIELKGISADKKMIDDVIRMVQIKNMQKEIVIMVSSEELVTYTKLQYPDIKTGFVFFFAFGNTGNFEADYIILEEDAATDTALDAIHMAEKYAVVWTVNTEESMKKFVAEDIDGIITDDVKNLKEIMTKQYRRSDLQILLDLIMPEH